ncbi:MAG: Zn-ribbon domain-containing OB-fold protein [archaeon]|nr:Zn-ribbon domain-containing OB-fold protein [archaeon]
MSEEKEFTIKNYFDYFAENKLMGSKCKKCGKMFIPPKKLCDSCMSTELEWIEFKGNGTLATYSLVHVGARYFSNQGYKMGKPYCMGVIKLEEGPCISAHVVGPEPEFESNPENFKIGMPLKIKFLKVEMEGKEPRLDLGFEPV